MTAVRRALRKTALTPFKTVFGAGEAPTHILLRQGGAGDQVAPRILEAVRAIQETVAAADAAGADRRPWLGPMGPVSASVALGEAWADHRRLEGRVFLESQALRCGEGERATTRIDCEVYHQVHVGGANARSFLSTFRAVEQPSWRYEAAVGPRRPRPAKRRRPRVAFMNGKFHL